MMPKHVGALYDYMLCVGGAFIDVMIEYVVTVHKLNSVTKTGAALSSKHSDIPVIC
jgi:hypothetical protein